MIQIMHHYMSVCEFEHERTQEKLRFSAYLRCSRSAAPAQDGSEPLQRGVDSERAMVYVPACARDRGLNLCLQFVGILPAVCLQSGVEGLQDL